MTPLWWTRLWVNTKKQSRDRTRDLPRTASWEILESCPEQPRFQFHPCLQSCDARRQIRCSQEWWHSQWFRGGPGLGRNTAPVLARSCNASTVLEYFKLFYCLCSLEKLNSVYFLNSSFIMCLNILYRWPLSFQLGFSKSFSRSTNLPNKYFVKRSSFTRRKKCTMRQFLSHCYSTLFSNLVKFSEFTKKLACYCETIKLLGCSWSWERNVPGSPRNVALTQRISNRWALMMRMLPPSVRKCRDVYQEPMIVALHLYEYFSKLIRCLTDTRRDSVVVW